MIDARLSDARYAMRQLVRHPAYALMAVLTLALGIAASTTMFSVVEAVILRKLPFNRPDRLAMIWTSPQGRSTDRVPASYPDVVDWQDHNPAFESIGAWGYNRYELRVDGASASGRAVMGSPALFPLLQATPLLGRLPAPSDEYQFVVTISDRMWQALFHRDPRALGRTVTMGNATYTVIGVMPAGFHFPVPDVDLWTSLAPMHANSGKAGVGDWFGARGLRGYGVIGRLRDGVSLERATRVMNDIEARLGRSYPEVDDGTTINLVPLREQMVGRVDRTLWLLFAATALVLLLGCANVAHLMLVRASARSREIRVRRALGAAQGAVVAQLLTESLMLALFGGAVGTLVASWTVQLLIRFGPADVPRLETATVNPLVLMFVLAVSVVTSLAFGIIPALQAGRADVASFGRSVGASRRTSQLRDFLVGGEVALAVVLLTGAGLMVRSFARLVHNDPGFTADHVLAFHLDLPLQRFSTTTQQSDAVERALSAIGQVPGVSVSGAGTSLPPTFIQRAESFTIEGEPPPPANTAPNAIYIPATAGYFDALKIRVRQGRQFDLTDNATSTPVAIVNQALVKRSLNGHDPIGRVINISGVPRRIVGVVGDVTYSGLQAPVEPQVFLPLAQDPIPGVWVAIRTTVPPDRLTTAVARAVTNVDPALSTSRMAPLQDLVASTVAEPRFQTWLIGIFGSIALTLAAIGIYGVVSYSVTQRTGEIGVRLALGAQRAGVARLMVQRSLIPVIAGVGVGIVVARAASAVLADLLFQIRATDATTFVSVSVTLLIVASAAAWLPARRASRVDPTVALRSQA